ncbi:UDP-3-O-acyl-N-acetylglucosamine deacetylase [Rhodobacteraceae bacterium 2CG4]|uniref:UDP-3-O-acyl-N-acetylglucosamine deacetylase n=1 Tax=Halovulum marinum TaxID=2662447 RepID=A0A6L5Z1W4_9RHOB|nr:UDP-3-O-acyl-N-acetylglucosamine deacetylase [Halovulum marinum]MSU90561.1 UDP-3-O-acyl-N-acetylglucosamine deacetylase [Halovulum marinum]
MQTTLKREVQLVGIGLHTGRPARITLRPADAATGVRFRRIDVTDRDPVVAARYVNVTDTTLNTRLTNAAGVSVSTVEHLMAAIAGCGLHNVLVDIDGPEIPIMDGSARRFVREIVGAGLISARAPLRVWRVLREVVLEEGDVRAALRPHDGLDIAFEIDFPDPAIGRQSFALDMANGAFVRELSDCRTFCRRAEVDYMQSRGLALGGTLDNAVVIDGADVLNPEGFRRADECVRHKMLDALGDLALAGAPIQGAYTGVKAGHGATNRLLRKLFATPGAVELVTCDPAVAQRLPGFGIRAADLAAAV